MNNIDEKLLKIFCRQFRKGVLQGRSSHKMCAIVSWALYGYLSFSGIKTTVHESEVEDSEIGDSNHIYLVMENGKVIDLTGDQFGKKYPQVYIGKPLDIHKGSLFKRNINLNLI